MIANKPVVAHVNDTFFVPSQTFINNYLVKFSKTHPICISLTPLENADLFPIPRTDLYSIRYRSFTPGWFLFGIIKQITGSRPALEYIIRRQKASLLHAHFGVAGYRLIELKRKLRLPLITSFYGYDLSPSFIVDGIQDWRKRLFENGDMFLVEGMHMQQLMVGLGCPPDKVHIQRIAIPVKDIPWRSRQNTDNHPPVVLFSGRFVEKKGLMYALEAINALKQAGKSLEFRIIGDGPQTALVKRYIEDHTMTSYTHLLGFLDHARYQKEMYSADIFLQPSVTASNGDIEGGAPTTILEAQAMGLPVVATHHCDIPNIVIPGQSAILVKERDITALTGALLYLLDHPSQWEHMGRIGRDFVQKYHDIDQEVMKLEDKYYTVMFKLD